MKIAREEPRIEIKKEDKKEIAERLALKTFIEKSPDYEAELNVELESKTPEELLDLGQDVEVPKRLYYSITVGVIV